jgi:hypothetical protein
MDLLAIMWLGQPFSLEGLTQVSVTKERKLIVFYVSTKQQNPLPKAK